jgi:hypothetical protein
VDIKVRHRQTDQRARADRKNVQQVDPLTSSPA